jgi:hypothetical protein
VTGSFEEVGWTGFATPRLLARRRLFVAGLWLGMVSVSVKVLVASVMPYPRAVSASQGQVFRD